MVIVDSCKFQQIINNIWPGVHFHFSSYNVLQFKVYYVCVKSLTDFLAS